MVVALPPLTRVRAASGDPRSLSRTRLAPETLGGHRLLWESDGTTEFDGTTRASAEDRSARRPGTSGAEAERSPCMEQQ